eukprot:COSAG01_NODE_21922_length_879_cov_1.453846_1_plen_80_part_10
MRTGVNMGTRFMATKECPIKDEIKLALVDGDERSTTHVRACNGPGGGNWGGGGGGGVGFEQEGCVVLGGGGGSSPVLAVV